MRLMTQNKRALTGKICMHVADFDSVAVIGRFSHEFFNDFEVY